MTDPLASVPPLIPLLQDHAGNSNKDLADLFSALVATDDQTSHSRTPMFAPHHSGTPIQCPGQRRARVAHSDSMDSTDSEFGAFVSVPASTDPLGNWEFIEADDGHEVVGEEERTHKKSGDVPKNLAPSSMLFDRLGHEAAQRTKQNEKRLLDELMDHERDPLAWLGGGKNVDRNSPSPLDDHERNGQHPQIASPVPIHPPETNLIDLGTPVSEAPAPRNRVLSRREASWYAHRAGTRSPPPTPTLPRSSSEASLSRTSADRDAGSNRPLTPPTLPPLGSSLSRSWMSSLISSTRAAPARPAHTSSPPSASASAYLVRTPSESSSDNTTPADGSTPSRNRNSSRNGTRSSTSLSPTQSHLHALVAKSQRDREHTVPQPTHSSSYFGSAPFAGALHAASVPAPTALGTGSSPFASQIYIPPSGAPGFTGDRQWNVGDFDHSKVHVYKSLNLLGRKDMTTPVLTLKLADALRSSLPALTRLPNAWTLLYSIDQHGISLSTLYQRCDVVPAGKAPGSAGQLLVVQDAEGGTFGCWMTEGVHLSHGVYYGGGDSFLWSTHPDRPNDVVVFKWTGKNDYVALCDPEYISFGGGEGHYGLYIDSSLIEGTSHPCPTFDNACLAQGEQKGHMIVFDCVGLEVWGVGP